MICCGYEHIDIQVTLSLVGLLGQYVSRVRMASLDLSGGRQAKTLRCAFVRFKFRHVNSPSLLIRGWWRFWLRCAATLVSLWPEDDEHLVPFHPRPCFNFTYVREILFKFFQNPRPELTVSHFASAEPDRGFHFVAIL